MEIITYFYFHTLLFIMKLTYMLLPNFHTDLIHSNCNMKMFSTYLLCYPLCCTNITQHLFFTSFTSDLRFNFYEIICDSSDIPWIFMAP